MKTKNKIKRKFKQNFGKILIIGNIALVGVAANLNSMALEWPIDADSPIITNQQKTRESGQNEPNLTLVWPEEDKIKQEVPLSVENQIREIAKKRNFKNIDKLLAVIECESKFNPNAININKGGSIDRGVAQWNNYYHSNMTDEQAFDVNYSVNKMMDYWEQGKSNLWACTKIVAQNNP